MELRPINKCTNGNWYMDPTKTKESPVTTEPVGEKPRERHKCQHCIGGCIVIHLERDDDGKLHRI